MKIRTPGTTMFPVTHGMKVARSVFVRIDWLDAGNEGVVTMTDADGLPLKSVVMTEGYTRTGLGEAVYVALGL